jgi:hypothetical protein
VDLKTGQRKWQDGLCTLSATDRFSGKRVSRLRRTECDANGPRVTREMPSECITGPIRRERVVVVLVRYERLPCFMREIRGAKWVKAQTCESGINLQIDHNSRSVHRALWRELAEWV